MNSNGKQPQEIREKPGISRRDILRRGAVVGTAAWVAPVVQKIRLSSSVAQQPSPVEPTPTATEVAIGGPDEIVKIDIANLSFGDPIVVRVGTTVLWTNLDIEAHTVTLTSGGSADSGILNPGSTFTLTFNDPGFVEYMCTIHPHMTSTITIVP